LSAQPVLPPSTPPDDDAPRVGRSLLWRGALAGVLICLMTAGAVSARCCSRSTRDHQHPRARGPRAIEIPEIDRADAARRRP
jgi:hypothetical protein